jgi:excisionase family DNA binding protein
MEKLISVKEVADKTGISVFTIQKLCREHKIPCYRLTRHYKFKESEIKEWLESKKQKLVKSNDIKIDLIREVRIS